MAKRITDMQRIISFGMGADESALVSAIDALTVIKGNRYPKDARKARKPRSDAGTKRPAAAGVAP